MINNDVPSDNSTEQVQDSKFDSQFINSRISVRYRRKDIKAVVKTRSLLFPQLIRVELLDISSKGAAIRSAKKLNLKGRVNVFLLFTDGKRFNIIATVNNRATPRYGLKFDSYQAELAEHLLTTQTDLSFS